MGNEEIAQELKDRQKAAWDKLHKRPRLEVTQWADLADELDGILDDIIEYFKPEAAMQS